MIKEIKLPAGGQTTDTSTIGTWLVKKGDKIQRGDALLEIETDKATLTVESFAKGTVLALLVEPGEELPAGTVIAYIGEESDMEEVNARLSGNSELPAADMETVSEDEEDDEDEYQPIDKNAPARHAKKEEPKVEEIKTVKVDLGNIKAMPNAKLMARENGISLADVAAFTGKSILKRQDVKAYLENGTKDTVVPLSKMRKVIAARMLESTQNIPTFTATVEVEMQQCMELRKQINTEYAKVSFNDIIFKCVEKAIRKFPYINASYTEDAIIIHKDVNIGLAVSVEDGLVVPVVKNVEKKSLFEVSDVNKENVAKARSGKLSLAEMQGGTITVSNLGMYPVLQFTPIINPPEVCILGVGAISDKPVFADGAWKSVPVMTITGSFDHRVIDGAYGAQFLTELKRVIENPALAFI